MKGQCHRFFSRTVCVVVCLSASCGCGMLRKDRYEPPRSTSVTPVGAPSGTTRPVIVPPDTGGMNIGISPSTEKSPELPALEDKSRQNLIISAARKKLGCSYSYGGKGPDRFDCSGFTAFVFRQAGISLGASSRDQFLQGRPIAKGEALRPGDLVFWNGRSIGNTVGHVGIVVDYDSSTDSFTFIHAAVSTGVEIMKSTAEYYARRYMGARRILDDIPAGTALLPDEPDIPAVEEEVYHTVKSGDTLSALAVRYHTTVSRLCGLNGISSKTILKIGRRLRVK